MVALPTQRAMSGKKAPLASSVAFGRNASYVKLQRLMLKGQCRSKAPNTFAPVAVAAADSKIEAKDSWISKALDVCAQSDAVGALAAMRTAALGQLKNNTMPNTKTEAYRFTDLLALVKTRLVAPSGSTDVFQENYSLEMANKSRVVMVDGVYRADLSDLSGLPAGAYVAPLSALPAAAVAQLPPLGKQSLEHGSLFAQLNSACAADVLCIVVEAGVQCACPLHVLALSSAAPAPGDAVSSHPRLLLIAQAGSSVEVVEEFAGSEAAVGGGGGGTYFTNAVMEAVLAEGANVKHSLVQSQSTEAAHMKATFVTQAERSSYSLTEASTGGTLARHDIKIVQLGEATQTSMSTFLLAGKNQLLDTHSSLVLDHPNSTSNQLHKCISADATARTVFDGNVQVNKMAQKTDAKQMSRNLLLCPKATVNVKPNLQIIADDVKCTHGCTVSDLEQEELFYFLARGIDQEMARNMLVFSFGQEVVQGLEYKDLRKRVEERVKSTLEIATKVF